METFCEIEQGNKDALLTVLRSLGVNSVTIAYSGGGDDGQLDAVSLTPPVEGVESAKVRVRVRRYGSFDPASGTVAEEIVEEERSVQEVAEDLANRAIDIHAAGYEVNEGGRGEFTLDVEGGGYTLEHTNYFTDSHTETYVG